MELVDIRRVCGELYIARGAGIITNAEYEALLERMSDIETALEPQEDVAPVVHGCNMDNAYSGLFECSVCGWSCGDTLHGDTETYNYCPNCGAKIDGTPKQDAKGRYNSIHAVNFIRELIDAARQKVPNNPAIHPKSKAFASGVEHGKRMAFDEATEICGQVEFSIGER